MNPCIVIANSCVTISPEKIIKELLGVEDLPDHLQILPEARSYTWHIDTKYYEADVQICSLEQKSIGTEEFAEAVNAIVLPFNSFSDQGLLQAEQWLSFTNQWDPEVKILLCDKCATDDVNLGAQNPSISKFHAQSWCVKHGFELVELDPISVEHDDSDFEDDFPETTGIKRVVQALHAHVWPNLILKENGSRPPPIAGLHTALNGLGNKSNFENGNLQENKTNGDSTHAAESDQGRKKLVAEVKPIPKETIVKPPNIAIVSPNVQPTTRETLDSSVGQNDPVQIHSDGSSGSGSVPSGLNPSPTRDERMDAMLQAMDSMPEETFEELFQNLTAMKSKAESLSPDQRKVYAEKMAVAFWKSIGGNDSEVDGLSSDED